MDTPICDFIDNYLKQPVSRFHMPGHKGTDPANASQNAPVSLFARDITEIEGADDLYHAEGIILKSEQTASSLFGSRHTFYSTEGSSLCIRAMLFLAMQYAVQSDIRSAITRPITAPRRRIIAARNAHKTFLYACALLDLEVLWLYPEKETQHHSLCSCPVSADTLQRMLETFSLSPKEERPFAVFLTSPDYLGGLQDIAALSSVCHRFGIPLLVDNAHGAYLRFLSPSRHPLDLGADMCCDSAHKTLPALTGCAYLHISKNTLYPYEKNARMALSLFGSTSPSYLLLQSLDWCNAYLAEANPAQSYQSRLTQCVSQKETVCRRLLQRGFFFRDADPLRIVFDAAAFGCSGEDLADHLRRRQIECEYADHDYVVLMVTPANSNEDWKKLETLELPSFIKPVLSDVDTDTTATAPSFLASTAKQALSIREAIFSPGELVPLQKASGRVCAAPVVSCPPAIPIVVSGERITEEHLALCRYYGITSLLVVAEEA